MNKKQSDTRPSRKTPTKHTARGTPLREDKAIFPIVGIGA